MATMKRALCIVSVYRPDLFDIALRAWAASPTVDVIRDRRLGERRRPEPSGLSPSDDRRSGKDRRQYDIGEDLRTRGYAIVPQ
jgi:hypothetical protein